MREPALKAQVWVSAQIRSCDLNSIPIFVRHKGDPDAGSILLKIDRMDGTSEVLSQIRGPNGERQWLRATGPEAVENAEAEAYIERGLGRDPDTWVIEIEDEKKRYEADAPIV